MFIQIICRQKLMNRTVRIQFAIHRKSTHSRVVETVSSTGQHDSKITATLKDLSTKCYSALLDVCRKLAAEKNLTINGIMNMQAIRAMSEKFPETEAEMLTLPHVTKANFEKFGKPLLEITQSYSAMKMSKFANN